MPLNVLVVDDHESMRQGLCDICTDLGHEVDSVTSGEEAIERVREKDYGLVLMDYSMPGISGIEATKKIREFDQETPIYLVSAEDFSRESDQRHLKEAGITGYIEKTTPIHKKIAAVLKEHDK